MSTYPTRISRELAAEYGAEAVRITGAGYYIASSGQTVSLAASIAAARAILSPIFAILDWADEQRSIGPFRRVQDFDT